jgi:hypothetical protein
MFPEEHVEAMLAAPPLDGAPRVDTPLLELVRQVLGRRRAGSVHVETGGVSVAATFR